VLESALDDWGFRRVDHERQGRLGGKTAGDLGHIGHSVLTGVVDTNVEDVAARPHRLLGQRRAGVPILFEHGVPETLGAIGIGALTHVEDRRRLVVGHVTVQRCAAGFERRVTPRRPAAGQGVHHRLQVGRRGAATSSHHADPELGGEAAVVLGQLVGSEVVVHLALHHRR
jgi:hypothetical protein